MEDLAVDLEEDLGEDLEEALAAHTGRERALLFSTGYMANLGVMSALLGKSDAVFEDRLNHASLLDGGLLSGARFRRFAHNDPTALERLLQRSDARRKLAVVDGVFSMDGDEAPLAALANVCEANDAWLMVDDAIRFDNSHHRKQNGKSQKEMYMTRRAIRKHEHFKLLQNTLDD